MDGKNSRQVAKTASKKVASTVATFLKEEIIRSLFRSGISNNYKLIVSEFVKVSVIREAPEKVTNMVGTFLNEFIFGGLFRRGIDYSYQQVVSEFVKVSVIREASEKVDATVTTFLNEDSDSLRIIGVTFSSKPVYISSNSTLNIFSLT